MRNHWLFFALSTWFFTAGATPLSAEYKAYCAKVPLSPPELLNQAVLAMELSSSAIASQQRYNRWRALLPQFDAKLTNDMGRNFTLGNNKTSLSTTVDQDNSVTYSFSLSWDFRDLYFNQQSLRLDWEIEDRKTKQLDLVDRLGRLLGEWHKYRSSHCDDAGLPIKKDIDPDWELVRLKLDILTNDAFSRALGIYL